MMIRWPLVCRSASAQLVLRLLIAIFHPCTLVLMRMLLTAPAPLYFLNTT